ncbi:MAG: glycosyltransferase [Ignavibacteriales bacterium]|nr:glycosyltransferase [Ignavibacteriales bacterium]
MDVSVCIPVYNEKLALRKTVLELKEMMDSLDYSYEILIIDDGSTDGCVETIADITEARVVRHKRNMGGGIARMTGIEHAKGDVILQTDADDTYPVDQVPKILEEMKTADMVVGARKYETAVDFRWIRVLIKWFLKTLGGVLAGFKIPDLNSGMRAYDRELARRYFYLYPRGHSIMSTITLAFLSEELIVKFVDIDYRVRKGKSSFRPIHDTYNYALTIVRTVMYFNPFRLMTPLTVVFFAAAVGFTIRDVVEYRNLGDATPFFYIMGLVVFIIGVVSDQFSRMSRQIRQGTEREWYFEKFVEEVDRDAEANSAPAKNSAPVSDAE